MNKQIAWMAALALAAFGSTAEAQTITAVYTTYSSTGVPIKLDITGTAFCTASTCKTKPPVVRLGGNTVAISGASPTGIGIPLTGVFADGDYMLSVTPPGKSAINYAFTLKGNTGGGATGPQGPIGPAGPAGSQGPQGLKGDTGAAGANGAPGLQGAVGSTGPQGPMGLQGPKGDAGDKGDKGDTGPSGSPAVGTYRGLWSQSVIYSEGDLVYTNIEPNGSFRMCLFVATPKAADVAQPNLNIAPVSSVNPLSSLAYWSALDPACRTALNPYSSVTPMSIGVGMWAEQMAFDGEFLWVANTYGQSLSKIRASDGGVAGVFPLSPYPRGIAFDGTYIWVSTENSNVLHKIRPSDDGLIASYGVGTYPIAVMPMNGFIWTVNHQAASVTKVAADGSSAQTYGVGSYPQSITNDGTYIYTADAGPSTVTKLLASTGAVVATFQMGFVPASVAFDGSFLWVAVDGGGLRKVDRDTGEIVLSTGTNIPGCCGYITGLVVDGGFIWANANTAGKVLKFSLSDGALVDQLITDVSGPIGLKIAGGHMWVTIGSQSKLLRF
jgi:hypothetical protein